MLYGDAKRVNTELGRIQAVTADQVKTALNKYIAGKKRVLIEFVPEQSKPPVIDPK